MSKTAVTFSPKCYEHDPGKNHPESAQRLRAIINELGKGQLSGRRNWEFVKPQKASIEDVELVHGIEYIRLVQAVCNSGGGLLDLEDTVVSPQSFDAALYAVGGTLDAVNLVMSGRYRNAFALVRPPGHHASKYRACGFCLFNNVAIAARYLLRKRGLKRVLILDIDAHHGNGTQETFYETDEVQYVSVHEDPSGFPGTGFAKETGKSRGLGRTVNIPLPYGTGNRIYLRAINEIVAPIVEQYRPHFLLVSAGLDGHCSDPIGNLALSTSCYREVFKAIVALASKECEGKLVSVLEGGYSLRFLGTTVALAIATMSHNPYEISEDAQGGNRHVERQGAKVLEEVKKAQMAFWSIE